MTSISTKFRVTLLKVGECLTENDVQNLAFLCEGIKPARRELLRNARELFVELQGRDLLHERNVTVLSGWLEELNLLDALRPLREYSENFLQSITQQQERCIEHEDLVLKYFCVTCDSKVCSDCALNLHDKSSHDVIKLADISNEISKRRVEVEEEIKTMSKRNKVIQQNWKEKKDFFSNCREKVRKEIHTDTILIHEKAEKNKLSLLKKLDEKEISDIKRLLKEREEIESVMNSVSNVKREMHELSSDSLSELRKLSKAKRKFTDIQGQLQKQETEVKKKCVDLLYKKLPNDGVSGILTLCSLVGGVAIRENQLLCVFDERQDNGGVRLVCIDPKDPSKEYWRHLVTVDDHLLSPVVMSCIGVWYEGKRHTLFAVGSTTFIVRPRWTGTLYDYVESVSTLVIDDVDEGSWISSIKGCDNPNDKDKDKFVMSVSNSSLLREYHVSGKALRKIETKDWVSSIISVAYVQDIFAIISRQDDNVILVTADSEVKQSGSLRPPSSSSCLSPINVMWTGADWLVLFISDGTENEWKVANYKQTGELIKVCAEGASCSQIDVPVSVTRWRNVGFVSFADNTVRIFEY